MKKYLIILSIFFASCSTIKIEEQIAQDFIKEKNLKKIPYLGASYLIEEAGSNENVLEYYKLAYLDKDLTFLDRRVLTLPHTINIWPINTIEIEKLINNKDTLSYHWNARKFGALEIPIMKKNELLSKADKGTLSISTTGHIISKPILNLNKKYAMIKYSNVSFPGNSSERFYIMEKKKGKWIVKIEMGKNQDMPDSP